MNNILISIIRFGAIAGIALFVFAGEVFAAPTLTPVAAEKVSETKATLSSMVETPPFKTAVVWFDYWGATPAPIISTEARSRFEGGHFEWGISDLRPCTTYSFRAIAREGGVTVISSNVGSFTTKGCPSVASVAPVAKVATTTVAVTNPSLPVSVSTNTNTNSNAASVIDAGGVLPSTLIWGIALILSLLFVVFLVRIILKSTEKRKKEREEAEAIRKKYKTSLLNGRAN